MHSHQTVLHRHHNVLPASQAFRTKVQHRSLSPEWDEELLRQSDGSERQLVVTLYHADAEDALPVSSLGQVRVPLRNGSTIIDQWFGLKDEDDLDVSSGSRRTLLQLRASYHPRTPVTSPAQPDSFDVSITHVPLYLPGEEAPAPALEPAVRPAPIVYRTRPESINATNNGRTQYKITSLPPPVPAPSLLGRDGKVVAQAAPAQAPPPSWYARYKQTQQHEREHKDRRRTEGLEALRQRQLISAPQAYIPPIPTYQGQAHHGHMQHHAPSRAPSSHSTQSHLKSGYHSAAPTLQGRPATTAGPPRVVPMYVPNTQVQSPAVPRERSNQMQSGYMYPKPSEPTASVPAGRRQVSFQAAAQRERFSQNVFQHSAPTPPWHLNYSTGRPSQSPMPHEQWPRHHAQAAPQMWPYPQPPQPERAVAYPPRYEALSGHVTPDTIKSGTRSPFALSAVTAPTPRVISALWSSTEDTAPFPQGYDPSQPYRNLSPSAVNVDLAPPPPGWAYPNSPMREGWMIRDSQNPFLQYAWQPRPEEPQHQRAVPHGIFPGKVVPIANNSPTMQPVEDVYIQPSRQPHLDSFNYMQNTPGTGQHMVNDLYSSPVEIPALAPTNLYPSPPNSGGHNIGSMERIFQAQARFVAQHGDAFAAYEQSQFQGASPTSPNSWQSIPRGGRSHGYDNLSTAEAAIMEAHDAIAAFDLLRERGEPRNIGRADAFGGEGEIQLM